MKRKNSTLPLQNNHQMLPVLVKRPFTGITCPRKKNFSQGAGKGSGAVRGSHPPPPQSSPLDPTRYSLHPAHHTLHPTPYTLHNHHHILPVLGDARQKNVKGSPTQSRISPSIQRILRKRTSHREQERARAQYEAAIPLLLKRTTDRSAKVLPIHAIAF